MNTEQKLAEALPKASQFDCATEQERAQFFKWFDYAFDPEAEEIVLNAFAAGMRYALAAYEAVKAEPTHADWRAALDPLMPLDFKDWWQNSPAELPGVAAAVIRSQREDRDLGWEQAAHKASTVVTVNESRIWRHAALGDFTTLDPGDEPGWVCFVRAEAKAGDSEPVGGLYQHCETGRTRIVLRGEVADCDARWFRVGDLVLAATPAAPAPARELKPLTDEQIRNAIDARLSWGLQNDIDEPFSLLAARAIERAHGITGDKHE